MDADYVADLEEGVWALPGCVAELAREDLNIALERKIEVIVYLTPVYVYYLYHRD